jgi:hypothetical protein
MQGFPAPQMRRVFMEGVDIRSDQRCDAKARQLLLKVGLGFFSSPSRL